MKRTPMSRRYAPTGPSRETLALLAERSGGRCELCGAAGEHTHHRRPRGMGSSRDPRINAFALGEPRLDFHDLLKASSMRLPPVQLMLPSTSDPRRARKRKRTQTERRIQDDATRAWNLHTALYYKALGRPWRIPRDTTDFTTCYVGISFFHAS